MKKALILVLVFALAGVAVPKQTARAQQQVYLGGTPLGIRTVQEGLVVQGFATVNDKESPAKAGGVRIGDVLLAVDGQKTDTRFEVQNALLLSRGGVVLSLLRDGSAQSVLVAPATEKGEKRLGLYLQEGAEGIGTLTYVTSDTMQYGALGHGIEADWGMAPLSEGAVFDTSILRVVKGEKGKAGELVGTIGQEEIGTLTANTAGGIFGEAYAAMVAGRPTVTVADRQAVHTGDAVIVCTLSGSSPVYYAASITAVQPKEEYKGIVLSMTDNRLLEQSGGIVQGMSGSPILQDGKLIGAVTHVTLENPRLGYGIFIDSMMAQSPSVAPTYLLQTPHTVYYAVFLFFGAWSCARRAMGLQTVAQILDITHPIDDSGHRVGCLVGLVRQRSHVYSHFRTHSRGHL